MAQLNMFQNAVGPVAFSIAQRAARAAAALRGNSNTVRGWATAAPAVDGVAPGRSLPHLRLEEHVVGAIVPVEDDLACDVP